jgi:hypothetical protein
MKGYALGLAVFNVGSTAREPSGKPCVLQGHGSGGNKGFRCGDQSAYAPPVKQFNHPASSMK